MEVPALQEMSETGEREPVDIHCEAGLITEIHPGMTGYRNIETLSRGESCALHV